MQVRLDQLKLNIRAATTPQRLEQAAYRGD
jgi:hypothetical protein